MARVVRLVGVDLQAALLRFGRRWFARSGSVDLKEGPASSRSWDRLALPMCGRALGGARIRILGIMSPHPRGSSQWEAEIHLVPLFGDAKKCGLSPHWSGFCAWRFERTLVSDPPPGSRVRIYDSRFGSNFVG